MADHLDSPGLMPPGGDASIDITDIYAFLKPGDATKSILILNVNPLTLAPGYNTSAIYEVKVDTDGDALADVAFKVRFTSVPGGGQTAEVRLATGAQAAGRDFIGQILFSGAVVSFGSSPTITTNGDFEFFAGRRSDPFFFDLLGFLNGFQFTGSDFFVDKNVFAIVLEVPNSSMGSDPNVGIWTRCTRPAVGPKTQIDRMGRPAINTVFNHLDAKNVF